MTFATATIQGFVNWRSSEPEISKSGRKVMNLIIGVPDKKQENNTTSFRISVWDNQAEAAHKYIQKNQVITASGALRETEYTNKDGVVMKMLRLDFATILDYGAQRTSKEEEIAEAYFASKSSKNTTFDGSNSPQQKKKS